MKVAVPLFGSRVSPRFDCAQIVLVLTVDAGDGEQRQELVASSWAPHERINRLTELGVETVICGGIDWWSAQSLQAAGITVYHSITGEVDQALASLKRGELVPFTQSERGGAADGQLLGEPVVTRLQEAGATPGSRWGSGPGDANAVVAVARAGGARSWSVADERPCAVMAESEGYAMKVVLRQGEEKCQVEIEPALGEWGR